MNRSKFVVVGLGVIGRELVRTLSEEYEIVCVDLDPGAPELARTLRGGDVRVLVADATSRLVLDQAGVAEADAVILTTSSEAVNLEVARVLAQHFTVPRVISVGITTGGIRGLGELGVEVENLFDQSAHAIRNRIEQRARAAHGIGLGRGEILEVEVHPNSRLVNKPLRALSPQRWRVGALYREGRILLPSGDTILRARDRALLVGEPAVLKTVSEMLTFRFLKFPLEYGSSLLVCCCGGEDASFFAELDYLLSVFPLEKAVVLRRRRTGGGSESTWQPPSSVGLEEREVSSHPMEAASRVVEEPGCRPGVIVFSRAAAVGSALPPGLDLRRKRALLRLSQATGRPILLAAGTFPYERVAVPCVPGVDVGHVLENVFEMAPSLHHETTALLVRPFQYLSTDEDVSEFAEARKTVSDMGLIYRVSPKVQVLEGNPVKAVSPALTDFRLAVVDTAGWTDGGWLGAVLQPDPVWHVVRRSPVSTLLVPAGEEAL